MERYPEGVSDADKAKARKLAEKMGAVTSYLDDATFVSSVSALCVAYRAYCEMASRRGWKCVQTKSEENQLPEVQLRILAFAANSGAWGEDTEMLWKLPRYILRRRSAYAGRPVWVVGGRHGQLLDAWGMSADHPDPLVAPVALPSRSIPWSAT
eukprot:COSAG06_NODE_4373_length_4321_cov_9.736855_2_plen_154_part_00